MSTTTRTYRFPVEYLDDALASVARVNRRAAKKGLPGYHVDYRRVMMPVHEQDHRGVNAGMVVGEREDVEFTVTGDAPHFGGWTFAAALDNDPEAGVITRPVPDVADGLDLSPFRARPGQCDHCGRRRHRRVTYVLRHDRGAVTQVGSTCLEAFLGMPVRWIVAPGDDPFAAAFDGYVGGGETRPPVDAALTAAVAAARLWGFRSRAAAREYGGEPTVELVASALLPVSRSDRELNRQLVGGATAADRARAALVRDWARAQSGGEYLDNLAAVTAADSVTARNLGLLVSAPAAYSRAVEREAYQRQQAVSDWQHRIGDRVQVDGEVTVVRGIAGDYGLRTLLVLRDGRGNLYKWVATGDRDVDPGDRLRLKATVKDHTTYGERRVRQTVLTRGTILEATAAGAVGGETGAAA